MVIYLLSIVFVARYFKNKLLFVLFVFKIIGYTENMYLLKKMWLKWKLKKKKKESWMSLWIEVHNIIMYKYDL
jgi:hypothetical protein